MFDLFYLFALDIGILMISVIILILVAARRKEKYEGLVSYISNEFKIAREESSASQLNSRRELSSAIEMFRKTNVDSQKELLAEIDALRERLLLGLHRSIGEMQESNERKLDQMRETVDEKLHKTLEIRLSRSFETVTNQLMAVQQGLGEMQSLASDVGSLKKVLSNVKSRGMLGEYQLANILEQILSPEQYAVNVRTKADSNDPVEFAVKLPGGGGRPLWLPIDAKFPTESYQRLNEAYENADKEEIAKQRKSLENALLKNAGTIREKYIDPPNTSDFAVMFLPFEGLYAEAIRCPGLFEKMQREYNITMTGPSTLTAFLNSLQIGFKTLAIGKQTSRIREILSAVKTEFVKFGDVLEAVRKNLNSASGNLEKVSVRARQMEKKLTETEYVFPDKGDRKA